MTQFDKCSEETTSRAIAFISSLICKNARDYLHHDLRTFLGKEYESITGDDAADILIISFLSLARVFFGIRGCTMEECRQCFEQMMEGYDKKK